MALSVVLATFNESKNITECIKSVIGLADEIIVVDGSSADDTVEKAKSLGAKVIITQNHPIFHINKQKAIDAATKDWVLQLDADERVDNSLANEIKNVIKDKNSKDGYWIPRKNLFLGRYLMKGGQYPDYTLRLYKKGKGKLPQVSVHEQAVVDGSVGFLKHPLIHIADPEFSRYLLRFNRYTDLIAKEIKSSKKGNSPITAIQYLLVFPIWWFLKTYIRHKGFMDSWQGFVFSFFSALRFPISYLKYIGRVI